MMGPTEPVVSGVITYNGDSDRGWNDPPTLSFTGVTASKKGPKLDLRKRVSHQEALTGRRIPSPSNQNTTNLYNQPNQLANGLSSLGLGQHSPSLQPVQPIISPAAISPCHSRHSSGSFTPPLGTECQSFPGASQVPPQYPLHNFLSNPPNTLDISVSQFPPNTGVIHPLVPTATTAPPPPAATAPVKISSPVTTSVPSSLGKPLFSFPSSLNVMPVSSALDTSHVRSNPDISLDSSENTQNSVGETQFSQNILPTFPRKEMIAPAQLIFTPSPTSTNSFTPLLPDAIGKRSPVLNRASYQNGSGSRYYTPPPITGSGRNSPSVSPVPLLSTVNKSPISTPTDGHSACSTPRSSSPDNGYRSNEVSRHNSEEFDSQEAMKVTVEALEETILKCSDILKNREVEDVKKKIGIMQQQWLDEKLSLPVQMTMKSLAKALLDIDTQIAHKLHIRLMVDYVGEVKQWMVAIKRLIAAIGNLHATIPAS